VSGRDLAELSSPELFEGAAQRHPKVEEHANLSLRELCALDHLNAYVRAGPSADQRPSQRFRVPPGGHAEVTFTAAASNQSSVRGYSSRHGSPLSQVTAFR